MKDVDATSLLLPSPLSLSPRGLIRARAAGLIPALIARLNKPVFDTTTLIHDALLLEKVLSDIDAGLEFAVRGGHAPLSRLLSHALVLNNSGNDDNDDDDDTALDALANCAALAMTSLPCGWPSGFPAPARLEALDAACASPLIFDFSSFANAPPIDAQALCDVTAITPPPPTPPLPAPLRVHVRLVSPLRARQTSQEDVGFALWPAAIPLSRWLVAHRGLLLSNGSRVLEIGAGVGLTGIVAALAASKKGDDDDDDDGTLPSVWLTDFNPKVLDNLARNAQLNEPQLHCGDSDDNELTTFGLVDGEPRLRIARDDWSEYGSFDSSTPSSSTPTSSTSTTIRNWEPKLPDSALFDVILGSDMICSKADAEGVAALLAARLSPNGIAVLLLPPSDVRWGVDAFPNAVTTVGLFFETRPLSPIFLSATYPPQTHGTAQGLVEADMTTASGYESRAQLFIIKRK
jgi:predicted nicotinamide N-methyase